RPQVYCSSYCKYKARKKIRNRRQCPHPCRVCGVMITWTGRTDLCSDACRKQHRRQYYQEWSRQPGNKQDRRSYRSSEEQLNKASYRFRRYCANPEVAEQVRQRNIKRFRSKQLLRFAKRLETTMVVMTNAKITADTSDLQSRRDALRDVSTE